LSIGNLSDEELMAAVGTRDMSALSELVRRHQEKVLALAYRLLGRWDLAEDASQNTFLKVYQAADRYKPNAKFTTWLYRIAVNHCHDLRRAEKQAGMNQKNRLDFSTGPSPADNVVQEENAAQIRQWIDSLPERQRTVLILHRYEGRSHKKLAQVTGWSPSAIESLLVRAYAHLRKVAEQWQDF